MLRCSSTIRSSRRGPSALAALAGAVLWTVSAGVLAASPPQEHLFKITDGDKPAGTLVVKLSSNGDDLAVDSKLDLLINRMLMKIKVAQTTQERWRKGQFMSLKSDTVAQTSLGDKTEALVVTRGADGGLSATYQQQPLALPAAALPMSLWRRQPVRNGNFFDLGNGEQAPLVVLPAKPVPVPAGFVFKDCKAQELELGGAKKIQAATWFQADGSPCGYRVTIDGDVFTYTRVKSLTP